MGAFHCSLLSFPALTIPCPQTYISFVLPFSLSFLHPIPTQSALYVICCFLMPLSRFALHLWLSIIWLLWCTSAWTFFKTLVFREGERRRNINFRLFHLFMHSVVGLWMCPDRGSNLQPWLIRLTLSLTELPGQGQHGLFCILFGVHLQSCISTFVFLQIKKNLSHYF